MTFEIALFLVIAEEHTSYINQDVLCVSNELAIIGKTVQVVTRAQIVPDFTPCTFVHDYPTR